MPKSLTPTIYGARENLNFFMSHLRSSLRAHRFKFRGFVFPLNSMEFCFVLFSPHEKCFETVPMNPTFPFKIQARWCKCCLRLSRVSEKRIRSEGAMFRLRDMNASD